MTEPAITPAEAAAEIGRLANLILALAPRAGLYVGITIKAAKPIAAVDASSHQEKEAA